MEYKKKFLKYQKKYNDLIGAAGPVRKSTIDFARMDEVASQKNTIIGLNMFAYSTKLLEICKTIQRYVNLQRGTYYSYSLQNDEFVREDIMMGDIHLVGGSALLYLDMLVNDNLTKDAFPRLIDTAPRTNDFDVSIYLDYYDESEIQKIIGIITTSLDTLDFFNTLKSHERLTVPRQEFEDITEADTLRNEKLIDIICANKIQITKMDRRNFINIRVNYKLNGNIEHLYEFVVWKDKSKKTFTQYLTMKDGIGIPDVYQLFLNYVRVMYRRTRKNIPKCRQDGARIEWLWNVINEIYNYSSQKTNKWITDQEYSNIRALWLSMQQNLPFCFEINPFKRKQIFEAERDNYFTNLYQSDHESLIKYLFKIESMDYDSFDPYE